MNPKIMDLGYAINYEPDDKTYVIRIFPERGYNYVPPLKNSDNWLDVNKYYFDDVNPHTLPFYSRAILFNNDLANRIITDFKKNISDIETLLVHCIYGKNRSPAVGIALNEIFDLGYDTNKLKEKYNEYNSFVYDEMINYSKKFNL